MNLDQLAGQGPFALAGLAFIACAVVATARGIRNALRGPDGGSRDLGMSGTDGLRAPGSTTPGGHSCAAERAARQH